MSFIKIKDFQNKKKFNLLEISKIVSKLVNVYYLNNKKKHILNKKVLSFERLSKINRYSKTKMIRYCVLTGRSRGSIRKTGGVSRVLLRDMLQLGIIPGYKKAVW